MTHPLRTKKKHPTRDGAHPVSRCVRATHASSCVAIERLLESPHDAAYGQSKSSAAGSDVFVCACRRLPTSSGCSPRTTCVSALPCAAAPRARSPPAPLQPCAQSPSKFAAAAVPAVSRGRSGSCPRDSGACRESAAARRPDADQRQGGGGGQGQGMRRMELASNSRSMGSGLGEQLQPHGGLVA